ncbi:MAG: hypothetical protein QOJ69_612 [Actinomycetota bacterium]|jgi:glycosyltransferase involved in cell wall biosynthesis|nr:hypothetical protein [Actinomycetota bacterium]
MRTVGYIPYAPTAHSVEAGWLGGHLGTPVQVVTGPTLNLAPPQPLPPLDELTTTVDDLLDLDAVVAEGPAGFLWSALLRAAGFAGAVTVLPYLNPRSWYDVAAAALYRRSATPGDRVFVGSTPSASVYGAVGVDARVGEPFGVDDDRFDVRPGARRVLAQLSIPPGRMLLFAGRAQPDKDLYRLLRVALKARVLFPDLRIVVATHVVDASYLEPVGAADGLHVVVDPTPDQLADLYNVADVFVTASTSHFETFGRAPAEALCCGTPAVAPRYDGFVEVLDQPGGTLVDVEVDLSTAAPHVDEAKLLRAVYDVLSDPQPPRRTDVATIARRRFGRSHTLRLFDDVPPTRTAHPVALDLPAAWHEPLAEIARRHPADAISYYWHHCDHAALSQADDDLVTKVRRALCAPVPVRVGADQEELQGCR